MNMPLALKIGGYDIDKIQDFKFDIDSASLGDIISALLKYLFPFAGILLFAYLVMGGFSFLTSGGDPKATEQAKGKITNAVVGFVILVVAYWIVQIFEFMFKIEVF